MCINLIHQPEIERFLDLPPDAPVVVLLKLAPGAWRPTGFAPRQRDVGQVPLDQRVKRQLMIHWPGLCSSCTATRCRWVTSPWLVSQRGNCQKGEGRLPRKNETTTNDQAREWFGKPTVGTGCASMVTGVGDLNDDLRCTVVSSACEWFEDMTEVGVEVLRCLESFCFGTMNSITAYSLHVFMCMNRCIH